MNRNKLAEIIESWEAYKDGIKKTAPEHYYQMNAIGLSDAIIEKSKELIETVKE